MMVLISLWILIALSGFLGWRAGALSKTPATVISGVFCSILVAGAYLIRRPAMIPDFFICPVMGYFLTSWFAPPAIGLFFIAARQAIERAAKNNQPYPHRMYHLLRALTIIVVAAASALAIEQLGWYSGVAGDLQPANIDRDGVVLQTSTYTCAASAAATLLRRLHIDPNATEAELAPLCMTRRWDGATPLCVAIALKSIVVPKGWHVRVVEADWDHLCHMKMPVIGVMTEHAVVICQADPSYGVQIADPIVGMYWRPIPDFRNHFENTAICVYRDSYE